MLLEYADCILIWCWACPSCLPVTAGAAYITYKGAMFVLRSLYANFPQIREVAAIVHRAVQVTIG